MSKSRQAASWAVNISNDPAHGYSQANRWGTDYDCSSFVIQAYEQAGVPVRRAGATYTGNMKAAFLACGFKDVTSKVNLANGYGLEPGDVLLNEQNHAAMALDNGQVVHARCSEGNNIPGDQSGNEIRIQPYWNFPWDCVLRYEEEEEQNDMQGVDISNYQRGLTIQQLEDAGKEFAIIKLTEGTWLVDKSSFDFYREAYELGFPVGCYCYSHAVNAQQAMAEAGYLMDALRGFPMPCGVFLDIEEPKQLDLPHDDLLNVIRGWCAGIGGKGYIPGIYGSEGNLWAKISPDELPSCLVWVAKWSDTPPDLPCDLWQNSDHGRIEGYSGNVDTDMAMSDYFSALVSRGFTNKESNSNVADDGKDVIIPTTVTTDAGIKATVMVLQMVMSYAGYWGAVTGERTQEFIDALRIFTADLEKM